MRLQNTGDAELYRLTLAGREEAFVTLYRRWQSAIYRFVLRVSGSASVAEDVTQEAFLSILSGGSAFDPALGSFPSYLFGIARNHVLRRMSRERPFASITDDCDEESWSGRSAMTDPLGDLTRRESIDAVQRAISSLPLRYREVVVLCELQEMSYAEAAGVMGCPEGTVRSRLHRARALLLEKLRPERKQQERAPGIIAMRCLP